MFSRILIALSLLIAALLVATPLAAQNAESSADASKREKPSEPEQVVDLVDQLDEVLKLSPNQEQRVRPIVHSAYNRVVEAERQHGDRRSADQHREVKQAVDSAADRIEGLLSFSQRFKFKFVRQKLHDRVQGAFR